MAGTTSMTFDQAAALLGMEEPPPTNASTPQPVYAAMNSPAWKEAWDHIIAEFGDPLCECPKTQETWQYMGTAYGDHGWQHSFRHRSLPSTGGREYREYPATPPDDSGFYKKPPLSEADCAGIPDCYAF